MYSQLPLGLCSLLGKQDIQSRCHKRMGGKEKEYYDDSLLLCLKIIDVKFEMRGKMHKVHSDPIQIV